MDDGRNSVNRARVQRLEAQRRLGRAGEPASFERLSDIRRACAKHLGAQVVPGWSAMLRVIACQTSLLAWRASRSTSTQLGAYESDYFHRYG